MSASEWFEIIVGIAKDFHKQKGGDISYTGRLCRPIPPDVKKALEGANRCSTDGTGRIGIQFFTGERRVGRRR